VITLVLFFFQFLYWIKAEISFSKLLCFRAYGYQSAAFCRKISCLGDQCEVGLIFPYFPAFQYNDFLGMYANPDTFSVFSVSVPEGQRTLYLYAAMDRLLSIPAVRTFKTEKSDNS